MFELESRLYDRRSIVEEARKMSDKKYSVFAEQYLERPTIETPLENPEIKALVTFCFTIYLPGVPIPDDVDDV